MKKKTTCAPLLFQKEDRSKEWRKENLRNMEEDNNLLCSKPEDLQNKQIDIGEGLAFKARTQEYKQKNQ